MVQGLCLSGFGKLVIDFSVGLLGGSALHKALTYTGQQHTK
jgi:hypothetical protein